LAGSTLVPSSVTTFPFTLITPATISSSAFLREHTPELATYRLSLIKPSSAEIAFGFRSRNVGLGPRCSNRFGDLLPVDSLREVPPSFRSDVLPPAGPLPGGASSFRWADW